MTTSKYALVERERRFLVDELPTAEPYATRTLTDLYIEGTRLRLRRVEGLVDGAPELTRKLTQKVPDPQAKDGRRGQITNTYLDESEYQLLAALPGLWISKTRLSFPPMAVDVFDGELRGLRIAEIEFDDDASMAAFVAPSWCGVEITGEAHLSGANLARIAALPADDAAAALAELLRTCRES